jgi:hypothetical protein
MAGQKPVASESTALTVEQLVAEVRGEPIPPKRTPALSAEPIAPIESIDPGAVDSEAVDTHVPVQAVEHVFSRAQSEETVLRPEARKQMSPEELFAALPAQERDRLIRSAALEMLSDDTEDDASEDESPEQEWEMVFDVESDDYVKRVKVTSEPEAARARDPIAWTDDFALGEAYYQGDHAAFDYRWCNRNDQYNLADRKNGFHPVKKALDTRFRESGGAVSNGDLILMRRPKTITEQRAAIQADLHTRLTSSTDEFHNEASRDGIPTFGGVTSSEGAYPTEDIPDRVQRAAKGTKTFAITVPFQQERLNIMKEPPQGRDRLSKVGSVGG